MHKIELFELIRSEIEDEIYRLQEWVEIEKSKGVNIDELLDNSTRFDVYEHYFSDEEFSIFILTVLNNFKSKDIINMLVNAIYNSKINSKLLNG